MDNASYREQEQGVCPTCGADGKLKYGAMEQNIDEIVHPYKCSECGFEGREVYTVEFMEHRDSEDNELEE